MHAGRLTVAAVLGAVLHADRPGDVVEELLGAMTAATAPGNARTQ